MYKGIGWLDKDCIFHECRYGEHAVLAFKLIKKYKKEVEASSDWAIFDEGIDLGLVCISNGSNFVSVELPRTISTSQIQWLQNAVKEKKFDEKTCRAMDEAVFDYYDFLVEIEEDSEQLWEDMDNKLITMKFDKKAYD